MRDELGAERRPVILRSSLSTPSPTSSPATPGRLHTSVLYKTRAIAGASSRRSAICWSAVTSGSVILEAERTPMPRASGSDVQMLALVPGVSRSGATIVGGSDAADRLRRPSSRFLSPFRMSADFAPEFLETTITDSGARHRNLVVSLPRSFPSLSQTFLPLVAGRVCRSRGSHRAGCRLMAPSARWVRDESGFAAGSSRGYSSWCRRRSIFALIWVFRVWMGYRAHVRPLLSGYPPEVPDGLGILTTRYILLVAWSRRTCWQTGLQGRGYLLRIRCFDTLRPCEEVFLAFHRTTNRLQGGVMIPGVARLYTCVQPGVLHPSAGHTSRSSPVCPPISVSRDVGSAA